MKVEHRMNSRLKDSYIGLELADVLAAEFWSISLVYSLYKGFYKMTNKITEMRYTILIFLIASSIAASTPQHVFATQQEPLSNSRQVQEDQTSYNINHYQQASVTTNTTASTSHLAFSFSSPLSTVTNSVVPKKLCGTAAAGAPLTNMRVTSRLVEFIAAYEGNAGMLAPSERLTGDTYGLYNDFQDNCTDAIGHLVHYGKCTSNDVALHKTTFPNGQTYAEAFKQFRQDLHYAENDVIDNVKVHLTQQQFDALVDFTFNEGINNLTNSKLLKDINAGNCDPSTIKSDLQAFTRQGALIARRDDESNMFNNGVYAGLPITRDG